MTGNDFIIEKIFVECKRRKRSTFRFTSLTKSLYGQCRQRSLVGGIFECNDTSGCNTRMTLSNSKPNQLGILWTMADVATQRVCVCSVCWQTIQMIFEVYRSSLRLACEFGKEKLLEMKLKGVRFHSTT